MFDWFKNYINSILLTNDTNKYIDYAIQFLLGGGIIVGTSLLAKYSSPKYTALLYAIPVQFVLAAIFIHSGTKEETVQELA